jgi:hypothetical protein
LINEHGIRPDPKKVEAIFNIKEPTNVTEVRSFIGLCSYYRKFIPLFSKIAGPLLNLTRNDVKFDWNSDCQNAFDRMKQILTTAPLLILPDFSKPFIIQSDASKQAFGAVLSQITEFGERPIAYASRTTIESEKNYNATELELTAIAWALDHFKQYVNGRQLIIHTDHQPISTLNKIHEPNSRIARILFNIQRYGATIEYKPGKINTNADALSRLKCNTISITPPDWAIIQDNSSLLEVKHKIRNNLRHELPNGFQKVAMLLHLNDQNVLVFRKNGLERIVVPNDRIEEIIHNFHCLPICGHMGVSKTICKIRKLYFWLNFSHSIVQFIRKCDVCQRLKALRQKVKAPMKIISALYPFDLIHVDVFGPLTRSESGNRYIIVVVDHFSKFVIAIAVPDFTALTTARFIVNQIICKYGMPGRICTDQGVNFESELFKYMCDLLQIAKVRSTTYHPQTNGQVERVNRILKQLIKCYVNDNHTNWDQYLDQLCCAINTSPSRTTNRTPFEILYGRDFTFPTQVNSNVNVRNQDEKEQVDKYVQQIQVNKERLRKIVEVETKKSSYQQKRHYDKGVNNQHQFQVNDLVLLQNFRQRTDHTAKFEPPFIGPYRIVKVSDDKLNYVVETLDKLDKYRVHYNRMRRYDGVVDGTTQPPRPRRGRPKKAQPKPSARGRGRPRKTLPTNPGYTRAQERVLNVGTPESDASSRHKGDARSKSTLVDTAAFRLRPRKPVQYAQ